MRALPILALVGLAACSRGPEATTQPVFPEQPREPLEVASGADVESTAEPAAGPEATTPRAPSIAEVRCLSEPLPDRIRVQFDPGHSARDLAVWYATTTCRAVTAPRPLLARTTLTQIDALANRDELLELFNSLLRGVGLTAVEQGDEIAVVVLPGAAADAASDHDHVVLSPVSDDDRDHHDELP